MPDDKKKAPKNYKGNSLEQVFDGEDFVGNYKTWRDNCQSISGAAMATKGPDLYTFLKNHFKKVRDKSRNKEFEGEGVGVILDVIDNIIDSDSYFTFGNAQIISGFVSVLKEMKNQGEVPSTEGGTGRAADPAFILFTEERKDRSGERLKPTTLQGHYATAKYAEKNSVPQAEDEWFAGENPPHQALFSETETQFAKPKGLLEILKAAANYDEDADLNLEVYDWSGSAEELEELSHIENYFDKVVRNNQFWSAGGKLLVNKVRKDFQNTKFQMTSKDQSIIREIANLGKEEDKNAIAGQVNEVRFNLKATALPIITLVDRALKRKGTNKAPNGFRAWQNSRKSGFDYRKTRREKFGDDAQGNLDNKVISKMWHQLLWRN